MKRYILLFISALLLSFNVTADDYSDTISKFKKAPETDPFFNQAYGYAVFPTVGKGGFGIGGAYGKGKVYRSGSATGESQLAQLTIGFQLGGQAYSQIIFFENLTAYQQFTSGSFEFGAQASAVAVTIGASAQAGTTGVGAGAAGKQTEAIYYKGMAVFTLAKGGLMYEATIGGQAFDYTAY